MKPNPRLFRHSKVRQLGAAPGTLVASSKAHKTVLTVIAFNENELVRKQIDSLDALDSILEAWPVAWINVGGLGSTDIIEAIGKKFDIHPLALEAVLDVHHRPKIEEFDRHLHIISKMALVKNDELIIEQIDIFLTDSIVLTFQENSGDDVFEPVRRRLVKQERRQRFMKPDYLAYALLDALVDGYFPVLEHFTDTLSGMEDIVISNPSPSFVEQCHMLKRDLQQLRHEIWPMREVLAKLSTDLSFIGDDTRIFFRSAHDHTIQVIDILETFRERASGLTDIYLSSLSNKMNEVMKVLTIIATTFIPLSFIAGLYGMNFDSEVSPFNMPELAWYYGYPFAIGLMLVFTISLMVYFWRKGWLGTGK